MRLHRTSNRIIATNVCGTETEALGEFGFKFDDTFGTFVVGYDERLLKHLATIPNVQFDDVLHAIHYTKSRWDSVEPMYFDDALRPPYHHQAIWNRLLFENERFLVAGEMGTGKSEPAITVGTHLFRAGEIDRIIVLTDLEVVDSWCTELIPDCTGVRSADLLGTAQARRRKLATAVAANTPFIVVNWDGMKVVSAELNDLVTEDSLIIFDESQRIKNHRTERFKTLWRICENNNVRRRWLLTGSPMSHAPEDIFGQAAFIDIRKFGPPNFKGYTIFRAQYIVTNPHEKYHVLGYRNMDRYMERFHSFAHVVTKDEALDLPPKVYKTVEFDLPVKLRNVYDDFINSGGLLRDQNDQPLYQAENALSLLAKGRQIVSNWVYLEDFDPFDEDSKPKRVVHKLRDDVSNPKMDYIVKLLKDTEAAAIIWYAQTADREVITERLRKEGISYEVISGDTPGTARGERKRRFQRGEVDVIVRQGTISTGVTLTRANLVIYYNNVYSLTDREQSEDRCHRLGTDHKVTYVDLVWKNTIEVRILDSLKSKMELKRIIVHKNFGTDKAIALLRGDPVRA